jgi:hypothetical protein
MTSSLNSIPVTVSFTVILAGCIPYSVAVDKVFDGDSTANDFVEVYVYDQRFYSRAPLDGAFNVQQPGFSGFYASTLNSAVEYTWSDLVSALSLSSVFPTVPSTWNPRNTVFDQVSGARVIDAIAETLRLVIGYDPSTNVLLAYPPAAMSSVNLSLLTTVDKYKLGGRASVRATKKLPGIYRVVFKYYNSGADPYMYRYYTKDVTGTLGGSASNIYVIHVGEYAIPHGDSTAAADIIAADVAARTEAFLSTTPDEALYAGWIPFQTDGHIRAVRWFSTREGAFTAIRMNSDRDFFPTDTYRKTLDAVSNQLVIGLGGQQSEMGLAGSRLLWPSSGGGSSGAMIPVLVNPNGTDGDGLPTYDLYALTDVGLVTPLNLSGPLPPLDSRMRGWVGIVITAAASGTVGVAYYRSGVIVLDHCPETGCVA